MTSAEQALRAYAAPIEQHAREHAAGVLDSIRCDVRAGVSTSVAAEAADVIASVECADNYGPAISALPSGARRWATEVWCDAFSAELSRLVEAHKVTAANSGRAVIREYLRGKENAV